MEDEIFNRFTLIEDYETNYNRRMTYVEYLENIVFEQQYAIYSMRAEMDDMNKDLTRIEKPV